MSRSKAASGGIKVVAKWPREQWLFNCPIGIATDESGNVYIADYGENTIQKYSSSGTLIAKWGGKGKGDGRFDWASIKEIDELGNTSWAFSGVHIGIAIDNIGNIFVADDGNNRIQKFDSNGKFLLKWGESGVGSGQFNLPQSIAVDTKGYIYVADEHNNRIQKFDSNGKFVSMWGKNGGKNGEYGTGNGEFDMPCGISADSNGDIYVADRGNVRIQKLTSDGKFKSRFGEFKSSAALGDSPIDIAIDKNDNIYIDKVTLSNHHSDTLGRWLQKYSTDGKLIAEWDNTMFQKKLFASRVWEFGFQQSIAASDGGIVYVVDAINRSIQRFSYLGKYLGSWRSWGNESGRFAYPSSIIADESGRVFVLDAKNYRVQEFTKGGKFVTSWGGYGSGRGQFFLANALAVDRKGNLLVADNLEKSRVQLFDPKGKYLSQISTLTMGITEKSSGMATDNKGNIYISDPLNSRILKYSTKGKYVATFGGTGSGKDLFGSPAGIVIDKNTNIYVVDTVNNRIVKLNSRGKLVGSWGKHGSKAGEFRTPRGVALDKAGNVYIADTGNNRIQVFSSKGKFITAFGKLGTGDGQFARPEGITVDSGGYIYVADTGNNRVQVFTPR